MATRPERPHLKWFDDAPKTPRAKKARSARVADQKVRALAGRLQTPRPKRQATPKPLASAGMLSRTPRVDRGTTRIPLRLNIPKLGKVRRRSLASFGK